MVLRDSDLMISTTSPNNNIGSVLTNNMNQPIKTMHSSQKNWKTDHKRKFTMGLTTDPDADSTVLASVVGRCQSTDNHYTHGGI